MSFHTILLIALFSHAKAATGNHFLNPKEGAEPWSTVTADEIERSLNMTMQELISGVNQQKIHKIESRTWQTYHAMPKNMNGRLAPRATRHVVNAYFAKEHGWLIKGLEPHGMSTQVSEIQHVNILQKAPVLVESVLELQKSNRGLSHTDVVAMIATLESLIFSESMHLLEAAYRFNGLSTADSVDETELHEILRSYLIIFEQGAKANLTDMKKHALIKAKAPAASDSWGDLVEFEQDAVKNFEFARRHKTNPFVPPTYSFDIVSQMMQELADGYGKWQNSECRRMKDELVSLSDQSSGLVPLTKFYSKPDAEGEYHFSESLPYLRETGALDETIPNAPRVRIPNYLTGPSNCIASSSFFSVCCLSECDGLMNELELTLQASTASPETLLDLVGNMSSSTIDAPRDLPGHLTEKLHSISAKHAGRVPLHGRLFAQWLHHAFPQECPFPQVVESAELLTTQRWADGKSIASAEERQLCVEATAHLFVEMPHQPTFEWSDEEVLPLQPEHKVRSSCSSLVRVVTQLAMCIWVLRALLMAWKKARHVHKSVDEDDLKIYAI